MGQAAVSMVLRDSDVTLFITLELLLLISSGLPQIPEVELESFSVKFLFSRCKDINNSEKVLL